MREALAMRGQFGRIGRSLRLIHASYAQPLDVTQLANGAHRVRTITGYSLSWNRLGQQGKIAAVFERMSWRATATPCGTVACGLCPVACALSTRFTKSIAPQ
jgi:hypothetical protein